ncbi:MAG: asparagine synthase (glutamine-hydrolyzing) [Phycisphaerae bacterium]
MCGIAGYVSPRSLSGGLIDEMVDRLAHRGPDGRGVFRDPRWGVALGHRRLAIVDRTGGGQPMHSACGRYVVVFNGEIYNHCELRAELLAAGERFRTESDTEVFLALWARHGPESYARLNGMYALALVDRRERTVWLARDPLGEKPLFYHAGMAGLAFASEVKSLLSFPGVERRVDAEALHHFLSLNYVPGAATLLESVRRVRPGHELRWRDGRLSERCFFRLAPRAGPAPGAAAALDELDALLDDAVRLRLRSDVPVGVFLSSGVDSSLIASSAARACGSIEAFSVGFSDARFSELPQAEATARRLGLRLTTAEVSADAAAVFPRLVRHADDPLADSSALAVWHLSRVARQRVIVALGGDGADELFGGYLTHRATLLVARYWSRLPAPMRRGVARLVARLPAGDGKVTLADRVRRFASRAELPAGAAHLAFNGTWMEADKRALYDPAWSARTRGLDSFAALAAGLGLSADRPTLGALLSADLSQYLPDDILAKTDRMSMAHGLEVRSPWLDPRLVSLALSLPDGLRVSATRGKVLLRRLAQRRGLTDVARRKKQGFSIPVHRWLREELRPLMESLLSPARLGAMGIFDSRAVRQRVAEHLDGAPLGFELWGLMTFMAWHAQVIDAAPREALSAAAPEAAFA